MLYISSIFPLDILKQKSTQKDIMQIKIPDSPLNEKWKKVESENLESNISFFCAAHTGSQVPHNLNV